jgi:hypothetical protein
VIRGSPWGVCRKKHSPTEALRAEVEMCVEMTRAEFLKNHPRRNVQIINPDTGEILEEIEVPKDLILCDFCNVEIGDRVWLIPGRAICESHYQQIVAPYILPYQTRASVAR